MAFIQNVVAFLKDVRNELGQVSWSPFKELVDSTKVVLVTGALLSLAIGVFDFFCARLMSWMVR